MQRAHPSVRQVMRHSKYDQSCDVYSWAMLSWELVTYRLPHDHLTPLQAAIEVERTGLRPELPPNCPQTIGELIESSWFEQPSERPSFAQLCARLKELQECSVEATQPGGVVHRRPQRTMLDFVEAKAAQQNAVWTDYDC